MDPGIRVGQVIERTLREKNIVVKYFLADMKKQYPEEHGLTENGFRYMLKHGTMRINLVLKLISVLEIPIDHIFPFIKNHKGSDNDENQRKRIKELEFDKEVLMKLLEVRESEIAALKEK
jgi:hypothetical protein